MKRKSERAVYAAPHITARTLAFRLRDHCFKILGALDTKLIRTEKFLDSLSLGASYIYVGLAHPGDRGEMKFEIAEEEKRESRVGDFAGTNWSCEVHVTPELDVFIEETTKPVPAYVARCIERGTL